MRIFKMKCSTLYCSVINDITVQFRQCQSDTINTIIKFVSSQGRHYRVHSIHMIMEKNGF